MMGTTRIHQSSNQSTDDICSGIGKIVREPEYLEKWNWKNFFPSVWDKKIRIAFICTLWNFQYFPSSNLIFCKNEQKQLLLLNLNKKYERWHSGFQKGNANYFQVQNLNAFGFEKLSCDLWFAVETFWESTWIAT